LQIKALYAQAKRKPQYLFKAVFIKANPVTGYFNLKNIETYYRPLALVGNI